ncbi:hypothetical protein ABZ707_01930 [Streptomyces sp. NPDC006923]|uniref:hypothetical protein n=1 Tax=Streptomyces sp. NPDC006923 TaxID=3155355 RepID=UPI0033FBA079
MTRQKIVGVESDGLPVDLETLTDTVTTALAITLNMPDRPQIDKVTRALIGHLGLLLGEDLGFDEDRTARGLYRSSYQLLESSRRPTPDTPHFGAFQYMRDVGVLTKRLAALYRERHEKGGQAGGTESE